MLSKIIRLTIISIVAILFLLHVAGICYEIRSLPIWFPKDCDVFALPLSLEAIEGGTEKQIPLTRWFYCKPVECGGQYYQAINIPCKLKKPIFAICSGKVIETDLQRFTGATIKVQNTSGLIILYYHLYNRDIPVKIGELIQRGQRIGTTSRTGRTTGGNLGIQALYKGKAVCISSPYDNLFGKIFRCVGNGQADLNRIREE